MDDVIVSSTLPMNWDIIQSLNWKWIFPSKKIANHIFPMVVNLFLPLNLPFSLDANQNDIPDVTPFKPAFNPIRVQKQTPAPIIEVTTSQPAYNFGLNDPYNPYGNPGPFAGDRYLPPNNYLPPQSDSVAPVRAAFSAQSNFLAPPADTQYTDSSSSVFKYV